MSTSACNRFSVSIPKPVVEVITAVPLEDVNSGAENTDNKDIKTEEQTLRNPLEETDTKAENKESESASAVVLPANTNVTDDSDQGSEIKQQDAEENNETGIMTSACNRFTISFTEQSPEICNAIPLGEVDSGTENTDNTNNRTEEQVLRNSVEEIDPKGDDQENESANASVIYGTTPVTDGSGQGSETTTENYSGSLIDDTQLLPEHNVLKNITVDAGDTASTDSIAVVANTDSSHQTSSKDNASVHQNDAKARLVKETVKEDKKEEKKKSKKKEDKSVEYILRALNSLQSPQEKLAALCKKYADLHEEHRVLQTSFKTQQRTLTVVAREKDQLQSEHTKAMIAKSKLESLCRELQKHNKIIKDESIKRAKEDDERRKEISAQFNVTIGEIQNQMSDNSEKNNRLRKENDNLAEQLRAFITQCQGREEHVKKLQEHHDLEKKLAAAKMAQADAILKEVEERGNKEKELILMKLTEITKKSQLTESQLTLYKSKYDEFNDLHTRSSETFQKYKTEMDKMTKRIKKLEKDGLQWKAKWESSSKSLVEQYEARTKSEKETVVGLQKIKRLESLCRALQAELHGKKVVQETDEGNDAKPSDLSTGDSPPSAALVNSRKPSVPDQGSPDTAEQVCLSETPTSSSNEPSTSASPTSSSDLPAQPSPELVVVAEADQVCPEQESISNGGNSEVDNSSVPVTVPSKEDAAVSPQTQPESQSEAGKVEFDVTV